MPFKPGLLLLLLACLAALAGPVHGQGPQLSLESSAFERVWRASDGQHMPGTGWIWGPQGWAEVQEPYQEAPGGYRWVRYYDKGRMEVADPGAERQAPWFVTSGLLVLELVTGQVQLGHRASAPACPHPSCAMPLPVVGDPGQDNPAPTYAELGALLADGQQSRAGQPGQPVLERIVRADGRLLLQQDPALGPAYAETRGAFYDAASGYSIPEVFWRFMDRAGASWLYLFGHPISAAYWTRASVGGLERDVLVQLFERRTLSFTPANPAGWQVEMGNVGQHYFQWRYGLSSPPPWATSAARDGLRLPVLLYHHIAANADPQDRERSILSVSPDKFDAQLGYLAAQGYTSISLDDYLAARAGQSLLPPRPVLLTFDDGYADFYTTAYPTLQRYQMRATLYIPSDKLGQPGYLSWDQLRELAASPLIEVAAHSRQHLMLDQLPPEVLYDEVVTSRAILERELGQPVLHFGYPYGRSSGSVQAAVRAAGYRTSVTTEPRPATLYDDALLLPRISISGLDELAGFRARLGQPAP